VHFSSQTLQGTVGGDVARFVRLGRQIGNWNGTAYSVIIDRPLALLRFLYWSLRFFPVHLRSYPT
jgi:hypothetical protein